MEINSKMHCGLKIMIELAMNGNEKGQSSQELAESLGVSEEIMSEVFSMLNLTGLIKNGNNTNDDYILAKDPSSICVYDIYRAFEPQLNINPCLKEYGICPQDCSCASRYFLSRFNLEMENFMLSYTLEKLVEVQHMLNRRKVNENIF